MKTAFPIYETPVTITLYSNIPFDNTYKNHSMISELFKYNNVNINTLSTVISTPKERFINRKDYSKTGHPYYYPRYSMSGTFNFDYSNGLVSSVVLELTPQQTNANYMKVRTSDGTTGVNDDVYYYFITSIQQINADTYRLTLELDVLMTYQDEFLEGMRNVPVFTQRKHSHRWTSDGLRPFSTDFKTGEDAFSNIKPSVVKEIISSLFHNTNINNTKTVIWLYICVDSIGDDNTSYLYNYSCNGVQYPLCMLAVPLNYPLIIETNEPQDFAVYTLEDIQNAISNVLVGNGSVHGAKISVYPPYNNADVRISQAGNLCIRAKSQTINTSNPFVDIMTYVVDTTGTTFISFNPKEGYIPQRNIVDALTNGCIIMTKTYLQPYQQDLNGMSGKFVNASKPTVLSNKYDDPKLLFSPFRKWVLSASYTSNGNEMFPELLYSEIVTNANTEYFQIESITTPYIGDNSIYTYQINVGGAFDNYKLSRIGLSGSMNYTVPVGKNALDVFNATQQQSFYTSKVASGVTSGLSIAGGVGSIGLGIAGAVGSLGMGSVASAGLIAGGATAIGSGIAGLVNTVKSTNAKIEDLKNTPDSVNVAGSNFLTDKIVMGAISNTPFIVCYDSTSVIKENANDWFYNYGYQVARECYFNTEIKYTPASHTNDNNLFGRTIFNYIQINEDITNKINYDMPFIVKQKLSKIFNDGITLWSWFGFDELWKNTNTPTSSYYLDRWFLKCDLDNTEYDLVVS